ncbi:ABC transporter ATP-binding protein [Halanaerobium praevalens]|uniref:ABC transporter related protein n=1 Tax=Halanaerobium praevalens (strain ATCC 33744 / DSM 2228 / GSL) TaxID=572479 RepID=E3DQ77_HALPG|nr:ABC transporter ATP-binding protein [Halanaerobium praevalens]ADO77854.1 ABC transporter related protein [Halanaerobium praevalens DSM 2228]
MFKLDKVQFKNILNIESLRLEQNKITAIKGSSGGGKTTFLKLLNNMITPEKGKITYKEKNIKDFDPALLRREVMMLPQNPKIFKGTIRDNFEKAELIRGGNLSSPERYNQLLVQVALTNSLNEQANNLSGGEKQRLALARIILLEPKVLLLDEPSSALDQKTEEKIIKMVVNYIKKNNRTLIMVTHSLQLAEVFADRIIEIENGKINNK